MAVSYSDHHPNDLGRLFSTGTLSGLSDWQLLNRYHLHRDELAFETLVTRLGPMVLGVCRGHLGDSNDVDDAFQATFLVLVRKASALRERDAIGPWLHGVACRVALRARSDLARQRRRSEHASDSPALVDHRERSKDDFELRPLLDQELSRLPEKYRMPIILCHLQGLSNVEAANQLNWPVGTVKGRLSRARSLLKERLVRRGVSASIAALAVSEPARVSAALPDSLRLATLAQAWNLALGPRSISLLTPSLHQLIEGVLRTMFWIKIRSLAAAVLGFGALSLGLGVAAQQATQRDEDPVGITAANAAALYPTEPKPSPTNDLADPISQTDDPGRSPESVATNSDSRPASGSQSKTLAERIFQDQLQTYREDDSVGSKLNSLVRWSKEVIDEEMTPENRLSPLSNHYKRMITLRNLVHRGMYKNPQPGLKLQADFFVQEASEMVGRERTREEASNQDSETRQQGKGTPNDPKSLAILKKLNEEITLNLAAETPLEEALNQIKTTASLDEGKEIQIYVDPIGLQEADKTMSSGVSLVLEDVPIKTALKLILSQIGLGYRVKDGVLIISYPESPLLSEQRLNELEFKAEQGVLEPGEKEELLDSLQTLLEVRKLKVELDKTEWPGNLGGGGGAATAPGSGGNQGGFQ